MDHDYADTGELIIGIAPALEPRHAHVRGTEEGIDVDYWEGVAFSL